MLVLQTSAILLWPPFLFRYRRIVIDSLARCGLQAFNRRGGEAKHHLGRHFECLRSMVCGLNQIIAAHVGTACAFNRQKKNQLAHVFPLTGVLMWTHLPTPP